MMAPSLCTKSRIVPYRINLFAVPVLVKLTSIRSLKQPQIMHLVCANVLIHRKEVDNDLLSTRVHSFWIGKARALGL